MDNENLSMAARAACADPTNDLFLSVVSVWELVIKHSIGRLELEAPPEILVPRERKRIGARRLSLHERDIFLLPNLPRHHGDPFDRMLVCQAIRGDLALVTKDGHIPKYPIKTLW